jgi:hypothetical protein
MKREFLQALKVGEMPLTKEVIDTIMDENGKDIEASKSAITEKDAAIAKLTTERDGLQTQIKDRDKDIKALQSQAGNSEALTKQLGELQSKYDTDTAELNKKMAEQAYSHATDKFFGGIEFASELAKEAAIAKFKTQGFKFDDKGACEQGTLWVESLKKRDPAAFKAAPDKSDETNQSGGESKPYFSGPAGNKGGGDSANPFAFQFSGVRPVPETKK